MSYQPQKLKPIHLEMIRLYWEGETIQDIATKTLYTPSQVGHIVNCDAAKAVLAQLENQTLDTMQQVALDAQFSAPALWDNLRKLAFSAGDERVRATCTMAALGIAGHVPTRKVQITGDNANQKKFPDEMSEDEIRESIRADLLGSTGQGEKPVLN